MLNTQIINDWNPETRSLIRALKKAGATNITQNNGEYISSLDKVGEAKFIEDCSACDETNVYAVMPDGKKVWLFLVYGNEPGVLVCDYSCHPILDKVTTDHYNNWANRKQPVTTL